MTFQTLSFIALLLAVFAVYWLLGRRQQNVLLLVASYVFYGYVDPLLMLLLGGFTVAMYVAGIGADAGKNASERWRRTSLYAAIASVLLVLVVFKYAGFFVDSASEFVGAIGLGTFSTHLNIILPIGISFYTLQALGYVIDVHRGQISARRNFIDFALFISFFPQLVAGPIERASRLLPQFENRRSIDAEDLRGAVTLLLWGFFKKLVIADNVGIIADRVFETESPDFALVWVGVLAFGLQIFADFSGYTDIARGTARLFGIRLSENFRHPYMARSPADFWRRWHVSLSSWFRDYVYIPLGGSRRGGGRNAFNLMATFLLSGLWHGAAWNFVLWGAYHWALVYLQRIVPVPVPLQRVMPAVAVPGTFIVITVGWLFFRASDMSHVWSLLAAAPWDQTASEIELAVFLLLQVAVWSLPVWLWVVWDRMQGSYEGLTGRLRLPALTGQTLAATLLFTGILIARQVDGGEFIYFQF